MQMPSRGRLGYKKPAQYMAITRRHRGRGFTLLELLVVSILMIGLTLMTAQLWRHYSLQAADLSARTGAAQELRLALDGLAADFGGGVWAEPTDDQGLRLCTVGPAGQGYAVICYAVTGGRLVRIDQAAGTSVTVAANVSEFAVTQVTSTVLQVNLGVTAGGTTRRTTLFWSPP